MRKDTVQTSRRSFMKKSGLAGLSLLGARFAHTRSDQPEGWDSELGEYRDARTGARVRMLTQRPGNDSVIYQTHPMWTRNMKHLVFQSGRAGYSAPHVLEMASGRTGVLTDRSTGAFVLARKEDRLVYMLDRDLYVTPVSLLPGERAGSEKIATLPKGISSIRGGLSLGADEKVLYTGAELEPEKKWGLLALELESGKWRTVTELDFLIGHVQANPFRPETIMFCHETGGDAPQRMWIVQSDGTGLRPWYKETYGEWVTHEAWWGPDRAIFTIWPYDEERKKKPHGILSADLKTGKTQLHYQYPAWHTHGSPDGKWIMGDDFDRNIWLIEAKSGERRLLTQGHKGGGHDTHPHASFTPDSRGIVFNSSKNGNEDIYLVEIPEWDSLAE